MKKILIETGASIAMLSVISIALCACNFHPHDLPRKKMPCWLVHRNSPPPRLPELPLEPSQTITYSGIAIRIAADRSVSINSDPVEWAFLEIILEDICQNSADRSIRIIHEEATLSEDIQCVMMIAQKLHLKVIEIIRLKKGQWARSSGR